MYTIQIIILIILIIGAFYPSIKLLIIKNNDTNFDIFTVFLSMVCMTMLILLAIGCIQYSNIDIKERTKCPQYEQITEPIYRQVK